MIPKMNFNLTFFYSPSDESRDTAVDSRMMPLSDPGARDNGHERPGDL